MNENARLEEALRALVASENAAQEQSRVRAFTDRMQAGEASFAVMVSLQDGTTVSLNDLDDLTAMAAVQIIVYREGDVFYAPLWHPKSPDNVYWLVRE